MLVSFFHLSTESQPRGEWDTKYNYQKNVPEMGKVSMAHNSFNLSSKLWRLKLRPLEGKKALTPKLESESVSKTQCTQLQVQIFAGINYHKSTNWWWPNSDLHASSFCSIYTLLYLSFIRSVTAKWQRERSQMIEGWFWSYLSAGQQKLLWLFQNHTYFAASIIMQCILFSPYKPLRAYKLLYRAQ